MELSGVEVIVPVDEPESPPCGMAFDPDPELLDATQRAADRWSAATGCDIRIEDGGVPVIVHDHLYAVKDPSQEICGLATCTEDESAVIKLDVSLACSDTEDTTTHEMGHALARLKRHSLTGVMASGMNKNRTTVIDAASLELVCYSFECAEIVPEISE